MTNAKIARRDAQRARRAAAASKASPAAATKGAAKSKGDKAPSGKSASQKPASSPSTKSKAETSKSKSEPTQWVITASSDSDRIGLLIDNKSDLLEGEEVQDYETWAADDAASS